jgi:uncharacterized protein (TIGR00369 family)
MSAPDDVLARLRAINELAAFNRWAGFEVTAAGPGTATLRLAWRDDFGQYVGHLHAGMVAALIDTACGFAASTLADVVVASQCSVCFLAPGVGTTFTATATTTKAGRRQLFTAAELHGTDAAGTTKLVATGQTLLVPTATT